MRDILTSFDLTDEDLSEAWEKLLEGTVDYETRNDLRKAFYAAEDKRARCCMLLEFSSYLQQGKPPNNADACVSSFRHRGRGLEPDTHVFKGDRPGAEPSLAVFSLAGNGEGSPEPHIVA